MSLARFILFADAVEKVFFKIPVTYCHFGQPLAVVKAAVHTYGEDIAAPGGYLFLLKGADPAFWKKDIHLNSGQT